MSLPKEIESNVWIKNWSGNWRTAFASLYWVYTTDLKPSIGKNLDLNLLVCEKESSSNYISKEDIDNYGNYVANKVVKDNKFAEKLASDTLITAKKLFEHLILLKDEKNLTQLNLLKLKNMFYIHIPPHFSLKKVIDYLPNKLQNDLSPMLIDARLKTENLFNQVDAALRNYASLISNKLGYSASLTEFLTIDEIMIFLEKNKSPSKKELIERSNGLILFCKGKKFSLFYGKDYIQLQKFLVNIDKTEFKGTTGYRGVAKGRARIVFNPNKAENFNEGDILVTGMTRPEFLPLMKKASAFVTDAGGMLSHAAIVARELKKPCVLATENATKIIKDGDEIEVDADKGIVRILKKS